MGGGSCSRNLISRSVVHICRAEFQPGVYFNSLALKNWMEQKLNNSIMEPFNPRLVAEYVTRAVIAENYYVLVTVIWGYKVMRWPQPD